MDLFYYSRIAYARTIAEDTGLTMVEESIDFPRTDGRTIYVPRYDITWEYEGKEATGWWGRFLHEIYHNDSRFDHPEAIKIMKKNKKELTRMLKNCWNLVEDHRIEHDEWGEFPGRDRTMLALRKDMYDKFKEGIKKTGCGNPKMDAIYWLQWYTFGEWLDIGYDPELMAVDVQPHFEKIKHFATDIRNLTTAQKAWDLSKKIVETLGDDSPKEEELEGKSKEAKEGEEGGDKVEADYDKFSDHSHDEDSKSASRVESKPTGIDHKPSVIMEVYPDKLPSYDTLSRIIAPKVRVEGLASQIKRYLLVQTRSNMVNNQKSGRIDTSSLWKASVYRNSASGSRVFQKETEHLNLDTAVSLLVDQSGSMSGGRYFNAAAAATVLNEVFSRIGVKTRITGFTDDPTYTYNVVHKDFAEKINKDKLITRFSKAGNWRMSGNADGENILWEFNKIINRPEKKKIMIVLSDGEPADSKAGNIYMFTKYVIENVQKSPVKIIGIGIESKAVERFYKIHKVLKDSTQIESTLLDILSKEVIHA